MQHQTHKPDTKIRETYRFSRQEIAAILVKWLSDEGITVPLGSLHVWASDRDEDGPFTLVVDYEPATKETV